MLDSLYFDVPLSKTARFAGNGQISRERMLVPVTCFVRLAGLAAPQRIAHLSICDFTTTKADKAAHSDERNQSTLE